MAFLYNRLSRFLFRAPQVAAQDADEMDIDTTIQNPQPSDLQTTQQQQQSDQAAAIRARDSWSYPMGGNSQATSQSQLNPPTTTTSAQGHAQRGPAHPGDDRPSGAASGHEAEAIHVARRRALRDHLASRPEERFRALVLLEQERLVEKWKACNLHCRYHLEGDARERLAKRIVWQRWEDQGICTGQWMGREAPRGQWPHESTRPSDAPEDVRELDRSRPYFQFVAEVAAERDHLEFLSDPPSLPFKLMGPTVSGFPPRGEAAEDLFSHAYANVRFGQWEAQGIWDFNWGSLPGLRWKHERHPAEVAGGRSGDAGVRAAENDAFDQYGSAESIRLRRIRMLDFMPHPVRSTIAESGQHTGRLQFEKRMPLVELREPTVDGEGWLERVKRRGREQYGAFGGVAQADAGSGAVFGPGRFSDPAQQRSGSRESEEGGVLAPRHEEDAGEANKENQSPVLLGTFAASEQGQDDRYASRPSILAREEEPRIERDWDGRIYEDDGRPAGLRAGGSLTQLGEDWNGFIIHEDGPDDLFPEGASTPARQGLAGPSRGLGLVNLPAAPMPALSGATAAARQQRQQQFEPPAYPEIHHQQQMVLPTTEQYAEVDFWRQRAQVPLETVQEEDEPSPEPGRAPNKENGEEVFAAIRRQLGRKRQAMAEIGLAHAEYAARAAGREFSEESHRRRVLGPLPTSPHNRVSKRTNRGSSRSSPAGRSPSAAPSAASSSSSSSAPTTAILASPPTGAPARQYTAAERSPSPPPPRDGPLTTVFAAPARAPTPWACKGKGKRLASDSPSPGGSDASSVDRAAAVAAGVVLRPRKRARVDAGPTRGSPEFQVSSMVLVAPETQRTPWGAPVGGDNGQVPPPPPPRRPCRVPLAETSLGVSPSPSPSPSPPPVSVAEDERDPSTELLSSGPDAETLTTNSIKVASVQDDQEDATEMEMPPPEVLSPRARAKQQQRRRERARRTSSEPLRRSLRVREKRGANEA